jgi:succinate dehydrogenase / fumarate reductase flavoprotein subunit
MMQSQVGIVRNEDDMLKALDGLNSLWRRMKKVRVIGNREYNPGWHTAMDLDSLLTVSEAIALAGLERKESRGAQFREDYPAKSEEFGNVLVVISKGSDGQMQVRQEPIPEMPVELKQIIEEMK